MSDIDVMEDTIEDILKHEIYTSILKGQERIDGLLGEFFEADLIPDKVYADLQGVSLKLDTVDDVINLIAGKVQCN